MEIVDKSLRETLRRINAYLVGAPISRYETKHFRAHKNPLLITFVRMTGSNLPWAAAYGYAKDASPKMIFAYDPRDQKQVAEFTEKLADAVLDHFGLEGYSHHPLRSGTIQHEDMPQLWLADDANLEMIHNLGFRFYSPRDTDGLNKLGFFGRLCTYLYEHASIKGHQLVVNASDALANLFVLPAGNHFSSSLASSLAWLNSNGSLKQARQDALRSLDLSTSVTLAPDVENQVAQALISTTVGEPINEFTRNEIEQLLRPQLATRWQLLTQAWQFVEADTRRENRFVAELVTDSLKDFKAAFLNPEGEREDEDDEPSRNPITDNDPMQASLHYLKALEADDKFVSFLVHDDNELLADVFYDGTAFMGTVRAVEPGTEVNDSWVWKVELSDKFGRLLKKRDNEHFCLIGKPTNPDAVISAFNKHVTSIPMQDSEHWLVDMTFSSKNAGTVPMTLGVGLPPKAQEWVGQEVIFVPSFAERLHKDAQNVVRNAPKRPGGWLFRRGTQK